MRVLTWFVVWGIAVATAGCHKGGGGTPDAGLPMDQCLDSADMAIIASIAPPASDGGLDGGVDAGLDGGWVDPVPGWLTGCTRAGGDCYQTAYYGTDDELRACLDTCLAPTTLGQLTYDCRLCYIDTVTCGRSQCAIACSGNDMVACTTCTMEKCTPSYTRCRGF